MPCLNAANSSLGPREDQRLKDIEKKGEKMLSKNIVKLMDAFGFEEWMSAITVNLRAFKMSEVMQDDLDPEHNVYHKEMDLYLDSMIRNSVGSHLLFMLDNSTSGIGNLTRLVDYFTPQTIQEFHTLSNQLSRMKMGRVEKMPDYIQRFTTIYERLQRCFTEHRRRQKKI